MKDGRYRSGVSRLLWYGVPYVRTSSVSQFMESLFFAHLYARANANADSNSVHKSYVLGFFEIALQTEISSTLYQRITVGSTEQPLHLPLVTNKKKVIMSDWCPE